MSEKNDVQIVKAENQGLIFQQDKALIDTQVATAKAYPRDTDACIKEVSTAINSDVEIAKVCNYAVPRGKGDKGKFIEGPSVHLARLIVQEYGNFRAESRVVEVTDKVVVAEAVAWDLQKNIADKKQVRKSILGKYGKYSEDMIIVTGNAACAIAYRNAVFAVVPRWIIDKMYKLSISKVVGDPKEKVKFEATKKSVFAKFKEQWGITEEQLLKIIDKPTLNDLTQNDLARLIGVGTAIADGDTTVDEVFNPKEPKEKKTGEQKKEELKNKLKDEKKEPTKEEIKQPEQPVIKELTDEDKKQIAADELKEAQEKEKRSKTPGRDKITPDKIEQTKITHNPTLDMM